MITLIEGKPGAGMTLTVPDQAARMAEGHTVVEWEYPDGSGSWQYGSMDDAYDTAFKKRAFEECRVWINGQETL